jgi:hypothetical protein
MVPTIGRRVWYWPRTTEHSHDPMQPFDAGVIFVYGPQQENVVNLLVTDHAGHVGVKVTVKMVEDSAAFEQKRGCWQWMPYQKAQAAEQAAQTPAPSNESMLAELARKFPPHRQDPRDLEVAAKVPMVQPEREEKEDKKEQ